LKTEISPALLSQDDISGISPLEKFVDFRGSVSQKAQSEINSGLFHIQYPPTHDIPFQNKQPRTAVRSDSHYSAYENNIWDAKLS